MSAMNVYEAFSAYEVLDIEKHMKKRLCSSVIRISLFSLLIVALAVILILFNDIVWVFLSSLFFIILFIILLMREIKTARFGPLTTAKGQIVRIYKQIKGVDNHPMATFGLFRRKYSNYWSDEVRLTVNFRDESDNIYTVQLNGITSAQSDFYNNGDEIAVIFGARFPIKHNFDTKSWICPICGKINSTASCHCGMCGRKILK